VRRVVIVSGGGKNAARWRRKHGEGMVWAEEHREVFVLFDDWDAACDWSVEMGVWGLGFGVWGLGFEVKIMAPKGQGSGFLAQGSGSGI
jgi:hypothetical protein